MLVSGIWKGILQFQIALIVSKQNIWWGLEERRGKKQTQNAVDILWHNIVFRCLSQDPKKTTTGLCNSPISCNRYPRNYYDYFEYWYLIGKALLDVAADLKESDTTTINQYWKVNNLLRSRNWGMLLSMHLLIEIFLE